MSLSRVFIAQPLSVGDKVTLEEPGSHHLQQVLRLTQGAEIALFNGDGREYWGTLTQTDKRHCVVTITGASAPEPLQKLEIHLGIGISRGKRMDIAIQKAVELGVTQLTPLFMQRSVVRLDSRRLTQRTQHWHSVMIHACEQSGRNRIAKLQPAGDLDDWLQQQPRTPGVVFEHSASQSLYQLPPPDSAIHLLIGPEGGLTQREHELAQQMGFQAVRLGPRILRTETAPIAAIAAIQTLWGDFRESNGD